MVAFVPCPAPRPSGSMRPVPAAASSPSLSLRRGAWRMASAGHRGGTARRPRRPHDTAAAPPDLTATAAAAAAAAAGANSSSSSSQQPVVQLEDIPAPVLHEVRRRVRRHAFTQRVSDVLRWPHVRFTGRLVAQPPPAAPAPFYQPSYSPTAVGVSPASPASPASASASATASALAEGPGRSDLALIFVPPGVIAAALRQVTATSTSTISSPSSPSSRQSRSSRTASTTKSTAAAAAAAAAADATDTAKSSGSSYSSRNKRAKADPFSLPRAHPPSPPEYASPLLRTARLMAEFELVGKSPAAVAEEERAARAMCDDLDRQMLAWSDHGLAMRTETDLRAPGGPQLYHENLLDHILL